MYIIPRNFMNNKTHFRKITILFLTLFIFSSSFNVTFASAGTNISTPSASVSGTNVRIANQLYVQVLGQPDGLAVIGINSIDGQTIAPRLCKPADSNRRCCPFSSSNYHRISLTPLYESSTNSKVMCTSCTRSGYSEIRT